MQPINHTPKRTKFAKRMKRWTIVIAILAVVIGIGVLTAQADRIRMLDSALDNTLDAKVFEMQNINDQIKALRAEQQKLCEEMWAMRPVSLWLYCD